MSQTTLHAFWQVVIYLIIIGAFLFVASIIDGMEPDVGRVDHQQVIQVEYNPLYPEYANVLLKERKILENGEVFERTYWAKNVPAYKLEHLLPGKNHPRLGSGRD